MDTVVAINYGLLWVAAHPAGTHQMTCDCEILYRLRPDFLGTRCFQNLTAALLEEVQHLQIVRVILERHAECGKPPGVF